MEEKKLISDSCELTTVLDETIYIYRDLLINKVFPLIKRTLQNGGKILTCGNGGSACCAAHLTEELIGKYNKIRPPYPSICLNSDSSVLTCIGNDFGFDMIFARQIDCLGKKDDLLIVFSTSGNSNNICYAIGEAIARNMKIISFLGKDGGKIQKSQLSDFNIIIPSDNTARIQEVHTFLLHSILEYLET